MALWTVIYFPDQLCHSPCNNSESVTWRKPTHCSGLKAWMPITPPVTIKRFIATFQKWNNKILISCSSFGTRWSASSAPIYNSYRIAQIPLLILTYCAFTALNHFFHFSFPCTFYIFLFFFISHNLSFINCFILLSTFLSWFSFLHFFQFSFFL